MSQNEIIQIKVGNASIGILGLETAIAEVTETYGDRPDAEIILELMNQLGRRNYIPEKAKGDYERAFLREFKKSLGKPFEEEAPAGLEIKVLGPGCATCDRLERDLIEGMAEMDIAADLEPVRDIKAIGQYGVLGTPALVINGRVKSVGKVPPRNKLKEWLMEAKKEAGHGY